MQFKETEESYIRQKTEAEIETVTLPNPAYLFRRHMTHTQMSLIFTLTIEIFNVIVKY